MAKTYYTYVKGVPRVAKLPGERFSMAGRYTLTQREIDEMRLLRMRDPETWSQKALAQKYGTTQGNVSKILNRHNRVDRIDIIKSTVHIRGTKKNEDEDDED